VRAQQGALQEGAEALALAYLRGHDLSSRDPQHITVLALSLFQPSYNGHEGGRITHGTLGSADIADAPRLLGQGDRLAV
jgi:hypothetical protein